MDKPINKLYQIDKSKQLIVSVIVLELIQAFFLKICFQTTSDIIIL